ncbi:MAG: hypothetical protein K1W09_02260 [Akkermansia muciniphila]|nr:hypothetical protein [uncultured Akkermansia sp.]
MLVVTSLDPASPRKTIRCTGTGMWGLIHVVAVIPVEAMLPVRTMAASE